LRRTFWFWVGPAVPTLRFFAFVGRCSPFFIPHPGPESPLNPFSHKFSPFSLWNHPPFVLVSIKRISINFYPPRPDDCWITPLKFFLFPFFDRAPKAPRRLAFFSFLPPPAILFIGDFRFFLFGEIFLGNLGQPLSNPPPTVAPEPLPFPFSKRCLRVRARWRRIFTNFQKNFLFVSIPSWVAFAFRSPTEPCPQMARAGPLPTGSPPSVLLARKTPGSHSFFCRFLFHHPSPGYPWKRDSKPPLLRLPPPPYVVIALHFPTSAPPHCSFFRVPDLWYPSRPRLLKSRSFLFFFRLPFYSPPGL